MKINNKIKLNKIKDKDKMNKNLTNNFFKSLVIFLLVLVGASNLVLADDFAYSKLTETLLNQDPDPVEPGEYVELRFKVEKEGNQELKDIKYELVPSYPFSFDGSDSPVKNLGNWIGTSADKEYYTLYYKLKVDEKALEGVYELKMYQSSLGTNTKKEIKFDVKVDEKQSPNLIIGNVQTSPTKLIANYDEALIKVEIVNIGDKKAEQVIVDLKVPQGFDESFGYSTRANIGNIEAGSSKYAEFYLDTKEGLSKGNKEAILNIQFKDTSKNREDEIQNLTMDFLIPIFGRPEYKLIDYEVLELAPGKKQDLKLKIQNIGSGSSDSTSIQIFKDSSQPFSFEDKSDFIGNIDVNEEGEVVFNIETDVDAEAKEYKLKLQIRSVVDGDVLVEDETINVIVKDLKKVNAGENPLLRYAIYSILLVIGLIVGYRYGLSRNKRK